jgi:hypothetical protein
VRWLLGWSKVGTVCRELRPLVLFARTLLQEAKRPIVLRWIPREENLAHAGAKSQMEHCRARGWTEELLPVRRHSEFKSLLLAARLGQAARLR